MEPVVNDGYQNTTREYSTLPEAVPGEFQPKSFPQIVPIERTGESKILYYSNDGQDGLQAQDGQLKGQEQQGVGISRPWWRRRLTWIIAIAVVVVVGLVVGLTAGLLTTRKNGNGPSPTKSSAPTTAADSAFGTPTVFSPDVTSQASTCRGTVCPSMLAAAQLKSDSPSFFIFGRGSDQTIWYRRGNRDAWVADWESLGGEFESQPAAVAVGNNRVDVFAVWTDGSVRSKTFEGDKWTSSWKNLEGSSINPPAVCSWGPDNIEVFATSESGGLMHRSFNGTDWDPDLSDGWQSWGGFTSAAASAVCPGADRVDVVSYGGLQGSLHDVGWIHYINGSWRGWEGNSKPGSDVGYRGDPTLVAVDDETTAVVGVGSDKQMYYTEWSTTANYSKTQALGGSFESAPHVLTAADGRIDVLAVGTDDTLMHKARVGGTWATDWEALGGYFNSVPLAIQSEDGWIAVFGIGPDRHMIHGNWTVTDKFVWGEGRWFDDSGSLSLSWFRAGPAR